VVKEYPQRFGHLVSEVQKYCGANIVMWELDVVSIVTGMHGPCREHLHYPIWL
jgi:hypothetical protein